MDRFKKRTEKYKMKSKEHCDSTISCSALLLISGRKIKMYYQKCRKNDHLDTNY